MSPLRDYVLVFVDVLGFSKIVLGADWSRILTLYAELHTLVGDFWGPTAGVISTEAEHTGSILFSDSALMWTPYSPAAADSLLALAAEFFCSCLRSGIMLRGAAASGEMLIDARKGIIVGPPLIHAARGEAAQQWSGIALCASLMNRAEMSVRRDLHVEYTAHKKSDAPYPEVLSDHVLDWRDTWERTRRNSDSAFDHLTRLWSIEQNLYIRATIEFLAR